MERIRLQLRLRRSGSRSEDRMGFFYVIAGYMCISAVIFIISIINAEDDPYEQEKEEGNGDNKTGL